MSACVPHSMSASNRELRVTALSHAELCGVGWGIGRVHTSPIPGDQTQPESKRTRRPHHGQHTSPRVEEQLKGLGTQTLPGLGER